MRVRQYLAAAALVGVGIASHAGGGDSDSGSLNVAASVDRSVTRTPGETVRQFYRTLYGDGDIDSADELYHPRSDSGGVDRDALEARGGPERVDATVQSVDVVERADERAKVHTEVRYATRSGSRTSTVLVTLRTDGDVWKISRCCTVVA